MSEQGRVRALLDEGRISQEEAEALLEALGDKDEADIVISPEDLSPGNATSEEGAREESKQENSKQENRVEETANAPLAPPSPPAPPGETPPPRSATSPNGNTTGDVTDGLRWVRVTMFAGNLEVRVDDELERPTTEGEVELTQEGRNYVVRQTLNEDFLSNLLNARRNVEVTLPAGYGVDLNMKGGNVDLYDVPFLRGKMMAGNLDARALGGIRLDMKAGNLDASLRLTEGEHRLDLKAGNGELRFLPGSSVTVSGEVKVGGVETRGGAFVFERGRNYVGGRFHGAVGAGRASLEISQTAGNLELAVGDA